VRCCLADDRGSVTAEFAIVLPVAMLVLGLCLAALSAATTNIANSAVARDAARSLSRGSAEAEVTYSVAVARPRAAMSIERSALAVCVRLREHALLMALIEAVPPMEVSACAVRE
jgi:Flp pilus assembly protein TadG